MKPLFITACILATLAHTAPVYAQSAQPLATLPEAQVLKPDINVDDYYGYIRKDTDLSIRFDTPMITADAVNTASAEGYIKLYYTESPAPVEYEAKWVSESEIKLTITGKTERMKYITAEVPQGLKDLEGKEYGGAKITRCSSSGIDVHYTGSGADPAVIFIGGHDAEDIELLRERIHTLYFSLGDKLIPANFRPATAGDATAHWEAYEDAFHYGMDDRDSTAMAALAPATPLPHTWVCEVPAYPAGKEALQLILPGGKGPGYRAEEYKDKTLYRKYAPSPKILISNTCDEPGKHTVTINFGVPAKADDMQALLSSLEWEVLDYKHNDTAVPLKWENGTMRTTIRGQEITIAVDEEATAEHIRHYKLADGQTVKGARTIILTADLGAENAPALQLSCLGHYPNITDTAGKYAQGDWTYLTPSTPFIYSDVSNGQLMSHGSTTINCEYGNIKNGKVRLCKLSPDARTVVNTINSYEAWYDSANNTAMQWEDHQQLKNNTTNRINKMRVLPSEFLPGVLHEKSYEFTGTNGQLSINLAEQFAGAEKTGLYFVEITGESIRKDDKNAPIVNQGLLQVTDLGLLWKLNGKRIFAWGYHLSDGKEVAQGTLRMLDAKGNTLAEAPLSHGMAQGDFPAGTKFLQLCTADDNVVIIHNRDASESNAAESWDSEKLASLGIPADELPQALIYTFSDRSIYRPGELAHIKGMVRWVVNNELQTPDIESITATVNLNGQKTEHTIIPEADGSFTLDITTQGTGTHCVEFSVKYKGDDTDASPDMAAFARYKVDPEDWYVKHNLITSSREASLYLNVEEFRRNEFEVESKLSVDKQERTLELQATATNFTTTPVAHGKVDWAVSYERYNFYPEQWQDYRFGDFSDNAWAHFYAYYMDDKSAGSEHLRNEYTEGKLDAAGKGNTCFTLPQVTCGRLAVTASASVTNGNEQTIKSVKETVVDPCTAYVGIKTEQRLMKAGQSMPVSLVAVTPKGEGLQGAPLQGSLKVTRTSHKAYRYGSAAVSGVHNVKEEEVVWESPVSISGTPGTVEIPLQHAGVYTIEASCTDAQGNTNTSIVKHYVWGEHESPWYYGHGTDLDLVADKDMYKVGDTANILVQTPVDAEVLVTVERGKVLRHYKRTITVNNPVIQVPVEAADAPVVYVGVSMVQSAANRKKDGAPLVKMGVCRLNVEAAEKVLSIELHAPQEHLLPTDTCYVSGTVRDAAGNPVPHADVTLYAEDEGTLQVLGYRLPTPQHFFYTEAGRPHGLNTYSALGQLYSDNKDRRYMGNKGVFVGGGSDYADSNAVSDEEAKYLRENFTPCALWLGSIKTDENGRFCTAYTNPDTLTRYRLMAVAADKDRFGSAKAAYHVTKPIMLEPVAPLGTTEGDLLHMPVTVSMLPEQLAEAANGAEVEWTVRLSGSNVTLPEPEKTVLLKGNEPVTITFPIKTEKTGKAELQWHVQATSPTAGSRLANCKDAVKLDFDVIPSTPFLRERIVRTLKNGESARLHDWINTDYRSDGTVELTMSTTPFAGLRYHLQYLLTYPYGCSEQLSSAIIPWILKPELEEALGMELPADKIREDVLIDTFARLCRRSLGDGAYSYWDGGKEPSEYSPYVVLVNQLVMEKELDVPGVSSYSMRWAYRNLADTALPQAKETDNNLAGVLTKVVQDNLQAPNLLSLYVLARAGELKYELLEQCIERMSHVHNATAEQRWMLALCARMLQHPMAEELKKQAVATLPQQYYHACVLPPLETLQVLYAIADAPQSEQTLNMVRDYLDNGISTYSTWRNAWAVLTVHEYLKHADLAANTATVNGQSITAESPLQMKLAYGSNDFYAVSGDTVYINGYAEGHQAKPQPVQAVDQGMKVTRRYEKLMPDGSWQPTATFAVGDVVKVHLSVAIDDHIDRNHLRYLVVEDRLPAAFEAVNPELSSQALPAGIDSAQARHWWSACGAVDNTEYLKDRVRFFASSIGSRTLEATYVARVLRRGNVTAPAAKAELMYRPEVRGLSIPQVMEVK